MKKQQYIQPHTSVIFVQSVLMQGASNKYSGSDSATLNPETMEEGTGEDAATRRRRSVWGEEEEEDF